MLFQVTSASAAQAQTKWLEMTSNLTGIIITIIVAYRSSLALPTYY
jgi:predicted exporter